MQLWAVSGSLEGLSGDIEMSKNENKTQPTVVKPADYIASLSEGRRKNEAEILLPWFERVVGMEPAMWGPSIIGFGRYHYKYESGREGDFMMTGFSPRKAAMSIYILPGYRFDSMQDKLARLGKHKVGKSCLYISNLEKVDLSVLEEIVTEGVDYMRANYQTWER